MPRRKSTFVEQAAILAMATLIVRFIGFIYRLPLTNLIGDEGNAFYAAGYNIYTFVLVVSSAGLPAAISKMVSERMALKQYRNAHEVFRAAMQTALVAGAAGTILLAVFANPLAKAAGYPESAYAIRTLAPTVLIVAIMAVIRGYFQGMHNTVPTALSQVIEQIFNAVFSVWLAYLLFDAARIELAAAGGTAGTGIGALAGLMVMVAIYKMGAPVFRTRARRDRDRKRYESRRVLVVEIIQTAFPIIIGTAIFSIANFIDMAMVADRLTDSGAFTYGQIQSLYGQLSGKYVLLTTLPVSVSTALAAAVIPSIAGSQVTRDYVAVKQKINTALRVSMIISIPAAIGIGVLSSPILTLLFPAHDDGGLLLRYGAISVIFLALVQIVTGILQGIGRVRIPVVGALAGALIKIPLNYFLIVIPAVNVVGAVISTCVCYMVAAVIDLYFLYRYTGIVPDWLGAFIKPTLASVVMGFSCYAAYYAFMYVSAHNAVSTLLAVMLGLMVYVLFMLLINGFSRADLAMMPMGKKLVHLLRLS